MAKAKSKGGQAQAGSRPTGQVITVGEDERRLLKKLREDRGWRQQDLATRVGVTAPTISNLETGRHPQIKKSVYAKLRKELRVVADNAEVNDDVFRAIVEGALGLDEKTQRAVANFIESLKKPV